MSALFALFGLSIQASQTDFFYKGTKYSLQSFFSEKCIHTSHSFLLTLACRAILPQARRRECEGREPAEEVDDQGIQHHGQLTCSTFITKWRLASAHLYTEAK